MNRLVFYAVFAVIVAAGFGASLLLKGDEPPAKPITNAGTANIGGPFALIDEDGRPITDQAFKDKFLLIFFGYTFCPDVCPTSLGLVAEALDTLGPDAEKVVPVFVSVDPARDTPAHLKEYVKKFHPRLRGLTGSPDQVARAAKAYKAFYAKAAGGDDKDYLIDHSALLYLMGPDGKFRAFFSHGTPGAEMAQRIKELL
ncbi:MAG: SCO family protein [Magnetospirillum sp. WYHS-4]